MAEVNGPPPDGGDWDAMTFCAACGWRAERQEHLLCAKHKRMHYAPAAPTPEFLVGHPYEIDLPAPPWLVEPMWPGIGVTLLTGKKYRFKSTTAIDLASRLASGAPVTGYGAAAPAPGPKRVLYCCGEKQATFRARLAATERRIGDMLRVCYSRFDLRQPEHLLALLDQERAAGFAPEALVFDTLHSYVGANFDENSNNDAGAFHRTLAMTELPALVCHHPGKGDSANTDDSRGASALRDDAYAHLVLSKLHDNDMRADVKLTGGDFAGWDGGTISVVESGGSIRINHWSWPGGGGKPDASQKIEQDLSDSSIARKVFQQAAAAEGWKPGDEILKQPDAEDAIRLAADSWTGLETIRPLKKGGMAPYANCVAAAAGIHETSSGRRQHLVVPDWAQGG